MLTSTIIILCFVAFAAGFVDAIVGGGGLIQTPTSILLLPQVPIATVIGSLNDGIFNEPITVAIGNCGSSKIEAGV